MSYDILPKAKLQYLLTRLKEVFDGIVQGHTIKNNTGTSMTTRTSVQFGGYLKTTDNSANDITMIDDSPIEITWADYQALTDVQRANNKYIITDYPSSGIEITDVGVPSTASVGQVPTVRNVGGSNVFVMETPQGVTRLQSLDMVGKTTTFNADGSISIVADDYSEDITFNANGSITDEVTINGVTTTKTITFNGSQITEVIS